MKLEFSWVDLVTLIIEIYDGPLPDIPVNSSKERMAEARLIQALRRLEMFGSWSHT